MEGLILVTPEQLRAFISDTIRSEISKLAPVGNTPTATAQTDDELLTRQQVADRLKISLPTLNELTKNGKITGYRIGNRVRYKAAEVQQALTQIKTSKVK